MHASHMTQQDRVMSKDEHQNITLASIVFPTLSLFTCNVEKGFTMRM
jgi:hypothetical protein